MVEASKKEFWGEKMDTRKERRFRVVLRDWEMMQGEVVNWRKEEKRGFDAS